MLATGFYPVDCKLYLQDKKAYFKLMDDVVKCARENHVGLIMSLFWAMPTVPDLVGEPCNQWGNPNSKTIAFMRNYIKDVVTRYKDEPAVWGWEYGNELHLDCDMPNPERWRPGTDKSLGMASSRSEKDDLTRAMMRSAFAEFAKAIRLYDKDRIIESGNGYPRPSEWHQTAHHSFDQDNERQAAQIFIGDCPDPMNVISVHMYRPVETAIQSRR